MKRIFINLCVVMFTVTVVQNISFAATIKGNVTGVLLIDRSEKLDKELSIDELKTYDWIRTSGHYQRVVVLSGFSVSLNNTKPRKLTKEGRYSFRVSSGEHVIHIFDPEGQEVGTREVVVGKTSIYFPIIIINDLGNVFEGGAKELFKHGGMHPCLDYNGPIGNCSSNVSWIQRLRNFFSSDCHQAMLRGHCWTESMPGRSCNHGGRNCSRFVGHSDEDHCHRF